MTGVAQLLKQPACTCPLRTKHLGTRLYPGLAMSHVDGCDWVAWFVQVDDEAAKLVGQRRASKALADWLGYGETFWWGRA